MLAKKMDIQTSSMSLRAIQYIDKPVPMHRLTHDTIGHIFLSRLLRLGMSLSESTLRSYSNGRWGLFKGPAIERLETECPVPHFDMSLGKHLRKEGLEKTAGLRVGEMGNQNGITTLAVDTNERLTH